MYIDQPLDVSEISRYADIGSTENVLTYQNDENFSL